MRRILTTTAALAVLAGCSSVDQVPLVYVSTTKVGLNVESGSAETPGASIMIGVDLTDAAYVPVAVARRCSGDTVEMMTLCADERLAIARILGTSNDLSENDKSEFTKLASDVQRLRDQMISADDSYSAALAAESAASLKLGEAREADKLAKTLQAEKTAAAADPAITFARQAELDSALTEAGQLKAREDALVTAQSQRIETRKELSDKRDSLSTLINQFRDLIPDRNGNQLDQADALSVFGTFKGNIGGRAGEETGAGVKLGKSFSTGVAAQHLSRGIADRELQIAKDRVECIKAVSAGFVALESGQKTVDNLTKLLAQCDD